MATKCQKLNMVSTFPAGIHHSFFSLFLVCTLTHAFATLFNLPIPITFCIHVLTNIFTVKIGTNFLSTPKPPALENMSISRFMLPANSYSSFWKSLSLPTSVPLTTCSRLAHHHLKHTHLSHCHITLFNFSSKLLSLSGIIPIYFYTDLSFVTSSL